MERMLVVVFDHEDKTHEALRALGRAERAERHRHLRRR